MRTLIAPLALLALTATVAARPPAYRAEEKSTVFNPSGNIYLPASVFVQGDHLRRDLKLSNMPNWSQSTLIRGGKAYLLLHTARQYASVDPKTMDDGTSTLLGAPGKPLGSADIGGEPCTRHQQGEWTTWVSKRTGVQIRRETQKNGKPGRRFDYTNVRIGPQPGKLFQLPADYKSAR